MKKGHINDWAPEVRALLKRLTDAGAKLVSGDNGEETFNYKEGEHEAFIENLIACDEARLWVHTPHCGAKTNRWIYLVLGNSPGEIASDYIVDELIDAVTDAHYEEWSQKAQPTKFDQRTADFEKRLAETARKTHEGATKILKLSGDMVVIPIVNGEAQVDDAT